MRISDERMEEFRRIFREVRGEEIAPEDARIMARNLVELYRLFMRPLPGEGGLRRPSPPRAQSAAEGA